MKAMLRITICVLTALTISTGSFAIDPHFSQFTAAPLYLNPGMTGVFSGNYRLTAVFRSQWSSVLRNENVPMFRTIAASYDMRHNLGFATQDAIGWGVSFYSDRAGALAFGTNHVSLSVAYIKGLSRKGNHFLTLGLQGGAAKRGFDLTNARFADAIVNQGATLENIDKTDFWYFNVSAGLFWYYVKEKRTNFWAGVGIFHVNQPTQTHFDVVAPGAVEPKLPLKISGSAGVQFPIGGQVDLLPSVLVMSQGKAIETSIGTYLKILFEPNQPQGNAFYIGPWYRIVGAEDKALASEALVLATRFDVSSFSIGFSYDLNFSDLTAASNARGAFEVSAVHVGTFKQKSKVKYCPRF